VRNHDRRCLQSSRVFDVRVLDDASQHLSVISTLLGRR
jgi:hypothetical protein